MTKFPNSSKKKYDLEERTAQFAEEIIEFCKKIPKNIITIPIISQLLRAGTSIGANYCEANGASSKRDFRNKIFICKKECRRLWQEAQEFNLIFSKIAASSK